MRRDSDVHHSLTMKQKFYNLKDPKFCKIHFTNVSNNKMCPQSVNELNRNEK